MSRTCRKHNVKGIATYGDCPKCLEEKAALSRASALPLVVCPCCEGKSKVPLDEALWRTLQRLRRSLGPCLTSDLQEPGVTPGAICNRLTGLQRLGLAKCVGKEGKWRLWSAVNDPIIMKTLALLLIAASLSACSVTWTPDGGKGVAIDGVQAYQVYLAVKAQREARAAAKQPQAVQPLP